MLSFWSLKMHLFLSSNGIAVNKTLGDKTWYAITITPGKHRDHSDRIGTICKFQTWRKRECICLFMYPNSNEPNYGRKWTRFRNKCSERAKKTIYKCGCHSCQFHFLVSTWPKWPVHYLNKLIVNKSNKSK